MMLFKRRIFGAHDRLHHVRRNIKQRHKLGIVRPHVKRNPFAFFDFNVVLKILVQPRWRITWPLRHFAIANTDRATQRGGVEIGPINHQFQIGCERALELIARQIRCHLGRDRSKHVLAVNRRNHKMAGNHSCHPGATVGEFAASQFEYTGNLDRQATRNKLTLS